jgi:hypothetical protein
VSSQPITTPYNLSDLTPQQLQVEASICRNKIVALDEQVESENQRLDEIEGLLIEHHAERRAEG